MQTLSFRLGPHHQLSLLSLVACPGSFFLLSPSSRGHRRPYKATFLLIHFCQFQHCHSNHCAGEWREAEFVVSLAARTVLFCPSLDDMTTPANCFLIKVCTHTHHTYTYIQTYFSEEYLHLLKCTGNEKMEAVLVKRKGERQHTLLSHLMYSNTHCVAT